MVRGRTDRTFVRIIHPNRLGSYVDELRTVSESSVFAGEDVLAESQCYYELLCTSCTPDNAPEIPSYLVEIAIGLAH